MKAGLPLVVIPQAAITGSAGEPRLYAVSGCPNAGCAWYRRGPRAIPSAPAMGPQLRTGATALAVHLMTDTRNRGTGVPGYRGTGQGPHGREATARNAIVKGR